MTPLALQTRVYILFGALATEGFKLESHHKREEGLYKV